MRFAWLLLVACSDPTPKKPPAAPVVVSKQPDPCAKLASSHRVTLALNTEAAISRDGRGVYRGHSIVHEGSATVIALELFGSPWLVDERERAYRPFGEHCARLVAVTRESVEVEIALQAAHEYDTHRCAMSCCASGASRAPDGTEECCFCSDAP